MSILPAKCCSTCIYIESFVPWRCSLVTEHCGLKLWGSHCDGCVHPDDCKGCIYEDDKKESEWLKEEEMTI